MNEIKKFIKSGWVFEYHPETNFIGAYHEQGGQQTVCEIKFFSKILRDDFGFNIAKFLNSDDN